MRPLFLLSAAVLGVLAATAEDRPGLVELRIVDAATGEATAARIELLDSQGRSQVADDAAPIGSDCTPRDFAWKNGEEAKQFVSRRMPSKFTGKDQFYSTGSSRLPLPPGRYRLSVWKGIEYRAQSQELTVEAGKTTELTVKMARWIKMSDRGWYGADGHLHIPRTSPDRNLPLARWMQAEDLPFVNLLQWGDSTKGFFNGAQYAFGAAGVFQDRGSFVAAGQENPRTHLLGHTMIWGGTAPIDTREEYLIYKRFWDEARRQGAVAGYAHLGLHANAQNGLSVDLPQTSLQFLEVLQGGLLVVDVWYNILNTGFRLAPVAGTDYPCMNSYPGRERFYAEIRGPVSYPAFLEGVRRGRTFVTNGPLLEFKVADQGIGGEVSLARSGTVPIRARVFFDPTRDDVEKLELVENGRLVETVTRSGNAAEILLQVKRPVQGAVWLAVRASGHKRGEIQQTPSLAHSGAVYVTVKNMPSLAESPVARALARAWLARLMELESRLINQTASVGTAGRGDDVTPDYVVKNRSALMQSIRVAKQAYSEQAR